MAATVVPNRYRMAVPATVISDRHTLATILQPGSSVDRYSSRRRAERYGPQQPWPVGPGGEDSQAGCKPQQVVFRGGVSGGHGIPGTQGAGYSAAGTWQPQSYQTVPDAVPAAIISNRHTLATSYSQAPQWTGTQAGEGQSVCGPAASANGLVGRTAKLDAGPDRECSNKSKPMANTP